jgi:hypothetical protein
MTSLGPWLLSDLLKFLEDEYPEKPPGAARIQRFLESSCETLALFSFSE